MASKTVSVDKLAEAIVKSLSDYHDYIADGTHDAVDKTSEKVMEEIKAHITFKRRRGDKYVRAFRVATSFQNKYNKRNTWHVKSPHYRLTHLLEYGHEYSFVTKNGVVSGKTRAFPHIRYGEEIALKMLPELIEKVIKGE